MFPDHQKPKEEWRNTLEVRCGWAKQWDPPEVPECVINRGCSMPPHSNDIIYGSFDSDSLKSLDVGAHYWYSCRSGMEILISSNLRLSQYAIEFPGAFGLGDETLDYIELTCKIDPKTKAPFFDPPYNHKFNPFPPCIIERK